MNGVVFSLLGVFITVVIYTYIYAFGAFIKSVNSRIFQSQTNFSVGIVSVFLIVLVGTFVSLFCQSFVLVFRSAFIVSLILLGLYWSRNREGIFRYKTEILCNTGVLGVMTFMLMCFQFYPYSEISNEIPANNFYLGLPIDYKISLMFAQSLEQGELLQFGDWLGSDRPPLFSGSILFFSLPWLGLEQTYLLVGTSLQLLVVPVSIRLMETFLERKAFLVEKFVLAFCLCSTPLFLHNISFLWPKIFAAVFLLLAVNFLFFANEDTRRESNVVAGILMVLSYLSHGGTAFAILAIAIVYIFRLRSVRQIWQSLPIGLVFVALCAPWIFYQKVIQPPGDRLIKWHILGKVEVVPEGVIDVFVNQYRDFKFLDLWERLEKSVLAQFNFYEYQNLGFSGVEPFVVGSFSKLNLSLGALSILFVFCVFHSNRKLRILNVLIILVMLSWFIIPFHGANSVHEGPYALPILMVLSAVIGAILLLRKLSSKALRSLGLGALCAPGLVSMSLFAVHRDANLTLHNLAPKNVYRLREVSGARVGTDFDRTEKTGMTIVGTFLNSDADTTQIVCLGESGRSIFYKTGPSAKGQSLVIENSSGEVIFSVRDQVYEDWTRIDIGSRDGIEVLINDEGDGWGQWSAVGFAQ